MRWKAWCRALFLWVALVVLWGGALSACGNPAAPLIRQFRFVGQDDQNPRIFYFDIDWTDNQGDLILVPAEGNPVQGSVIFTLQDLDIKDTPKEVKLPITPLMLQVGDFEGVMRKIAISIGADKYPSQIRISVVIVDGAGNRSNEPWVIIQSKS